MAIEDEFIHWLILFENIVTEIQFIKYTHYITILFKFDSDEQLWKQWVASTNSKCNSHPSNWMVSMAGCILHIEPKSYYLPHWRTFYLYFFFFVEVPKNTQTLVTRDSSRVNWKKKFMHFHSSNSQLFWILHIFLSLFIRYDFRECGQHTDVACPQKRRQQNIFFDFWPWENCIWRKCEKTIRFKLHFLFLCLISNRGCWVWCIWLHWNLQHEQ